MYFELLDDGYTLPEAVFFIRSVYAVLELQIRAKQSQVRKERLDRICDPDMRRTVAPENVFEADLIAMMDDMDRTQQEIDRTQQEMIDRTQQEIDRAQQEINRTQQEIDRAQQEVDRTQQKIGGVIGSVNFDEYIAETAAIVQRMSDQTYPLVDQAGGVHTPIESVVACDKKKVQTERVAVRQSPALPLPAPAKPVGVLAKLRSLFS
jgi:hypothetical protein